MRIDDELHQKIINKVKETVDKINGHYHLGMKVPPVYYDVSGTTAGIAKSASMSIHLNPKLLLQNLDDSINNTVPHEVCHLGVFQKARNANKPFPKAHGAEWKLMMWVVGASANNTHSYDVEDVRKLPIQYEYQCACPQPTVMNQATHNKIKRAKTDGKVYSCRKCHKVLENGQRILRYGFSRPSPNGTTKLRE